MPRLLATIAAAAGLLVGPALLFAPVAGGQVPAQFLPSQVQAPATTPSVNLTVEQRHIIREIVKEMNVPAANSNVPLEAGAVVPNDVVLNPMPALVAQKVPQVKAHLFFVQDDRIALVNAKDKTIAEVIE